MNVTSSSSTLRLPLYIGLSTILMLLATLSICKLSPLLITIGRQTPSASRLLHLAHPSVWSQFLYGPSVYIARLLYALQKEHPYEPPVNTVSVVCVSDTHNTEPPLPNGDILIHAGDLSLDGTQREIQAALNWLNTLPHEHKIVVAGNHDTLLEGHKEGSDNAQLDWGRRHLSRGRSHRGGLRQRTHNQCVWQSQVPETRKPGVSVYTGRGRVVSQGP